MEGEMITQRLRRAGNSFVVTIPRHEVERLGIREGDLVAVELQPVEIRPRLTPELRSIAEATWERNQAAYRYLGGQPGGQDEP
jgi:antitoxin component of MazEF toxin-antitoxin module